MIMAIDPGSTVSGVAILSEGKHRFRMALSLRPSKKDPHAITLGVAALIEFFKVKKVYIEKSAFMQGSARGHAVAARGDLVTLSIFIGRLVQVVETLGAEAILVPVSTWKGQLPKEVANRRVAMKMQIGPKVFNDHELDALGIGLWAQGRF